MADPRPSSLHPLTSYRSLPSGPSAWLVKPIIPVGGSALLGGVPKLGKTAAALQLCFAVASGQDWMGYPTVQSRVAYLQIDTPRSIWKERFTLLESAGVTLPSDEWFATADRESLPYPFNILDPAHAEGLREDLAGFNPGLVVVDTLRESFRGDENESDRLQQVLSSFTLVCRPAALLYVHHGKKAGDPAWEPSLVDMFRGSSYIPGAVDTLLYLKGKRKPQEENVHGSLTYHGRSIEESTLDLIQDKHRGYFWYPEAEDPFAKAVRDVLADDTHPSDRERARDLHTRFPDRSEDACRKAVGRARLAKGGG